MENRQLFKLKGKKLSESGFTGLADVSKTENKSSSMLSYL
jgi:hypothetical protein